MPLITITSDWSKNDWYLPVLKGKLLGLYPSASIVDISNSIRPFDIYQACFVLRHSYKSFPIGSIHILAVNSEPEPGHRIVAARKDGHYFVSVDDGRFPLLFDDLSQVCSFEVEQVGGGGTFKAADYFCRAVEGILSGREMKEGLLRAGGAEHAAVLPDKITGRVVYIDSYGNAITNISKRDFLKVYEMASQQGHIPDFTIYVGGPYLKFEDIHEGYNSVVQGNEVAFFNSLDLLEFAVNKGNFAAAEDVDPTTEVLVRFVKM